ncbi:Ig-like domain-containing protein [Cohnella silvisoli]|uniref:Ig-like domain-containing protein n=1 Tax=Cohnella silvisoli TaxID=2873699 RepID=A0ABV1KKU7_9BACL|nr:Ig-like domain-containing protein [Cohnella silvisoli]MCD9020882.1 Ig-like domain-containing protein [Cohnella silvisoli]
MEILHDWIKETHPQPEARGIPEDTLISIIFNQDINRNTLNTRNILILDGNRGGRLISNRFLYRYDADFRTLTIYLKDDAERPGSNNTIEIILTGRIANYQNNRMEIPFHFRFATR